MSVRLPRPAVATTALPALAAVLAAGCHDPRCGDSRADELKAHTPEIQRGARAGDPADVLHGIAVAIGLVGHTSTTVGDPVQTDGEPMAVTSVPVTPLPVVTEVDGGMRAASPLPATPPAVPGGGQRTGGAVRQVDPAPATVHHPPHTPMVMGRRAAVSPAWDREAPRPEGHGAGRGGRGGAQ